MMQKGVPQYLHLQTFPGLQIYASAAGGFKEFFIFTPEPWGNDIQFDEDIFFTWVGSTTN